MKNLELVPISRLAQINPKSDVKELNRNSLVSFIPMGDVSESGRWLGRQDKPLKGVSNGYTCFQEGDILFAKITPCMENGKGAHAIGLTNGLGFGTTEFHVLRATSETHPRYLFHWTRNEILRRLAEVHMIGSAGQKRVPEDFFHTFKVPYFSFSEQQGIADILDAADEAIQKTEVLIAKLKAMKQGLLNDLLTRGLDENGNPRDPKTHPEQFKDSPLGKIPKKWQIHTLSYICEWDGGSVQTGPFGTQLHARDYETEGVPIITVEHLGENEIIHSNLPLVGAHDYERLKKYHIREGDLVFSRVGAIDRCAYVSEAENGWLFSGRCLRVRMGGKRVNSKFFSYQLNSHRARVWILDHSVGSTMSCLNTTILSQVPLLLPSLTEQENIVSTLENHDARIQAEERYRDKLKLIKKGLMNDLLTGKVRVWSEEH